MVYKQCDFADFVVEKTGHLA